MCECKLRRRNTATTRSGILRKMINITGIYKPAHDLINGCQIGTTLFMPNIEQSAEVKEETFIVLLEAHTKKPEWFEITKHDYLDFLKARHRPSIDKYVQDMLDKIDGNYKDEHEHVDYALKDRIDAELINIQAKTDSLTDTEAALLNRLGEQTTNKEMLEIITALDKERAEANKATDEAPTDEAPTDEAPTDEAPTDEAPTDEAPTDEAPTDEAPTDEVPTKTTTKTTTKKNSKSTK